MYTNLMHQTPWLASLASHLWQSTALVTAAWMLAFALRKNQARIRYWVWLTASLKFLLPFSLLVEAGQHLASLVTVPAVRPTISRAMEQMAQVALPFQQGHWVAIEPIQTTGHNGLMPAILLALWAAGAFIVARAWAREWWRIRAAVRQASPQAFAVGVPVLSSSSLLEPGIFGIMQPVLLLPAGITDRLSQAQMSAIFAHEMCHVKRRDNLTFALHMAVETLFWFHPLVWWIRARLIEEREQACDEAVLQSGSKAEVYAEGILNVCKFYVESPLACVSGVTGSDLKKRIVRIMTLSAVQKLGPMRMALLAAAVALALMLPVVSGLLHTAGVQAQEDAAAAMPEFEVATIKPSKAGNNERSLMMSPGKFTMVGMPIDEVIRFAYDLKSDEQLAGGPGWIHSDKFDIEAKESEAEVQMLEKLPRGQGALQVRLMVRSLLADRFNLKISHDSKELPVYALLVAKNGPKMTVAEAPSPNPPGEIKPGDPPHKNAMSGIRISGRGQVEGINTPTDVLADVLSRQQELGNRLVLDKTGLAGHYNWKLNWTPSDAQPPVGADGAPGSPADTSAPSLFTAVQEQLGLKLEPQKAPIDVVVVDHIDPPTAN
jgi:bla regulator protein blaR1